jgi:hypothetical protein
MTLDFIDKMLGRFERFGDSEDDHPKKMRLLESINNILSVLSYNLRALAESGDESLHCLVDKKNYQAVQKVEDIYDQICSVVMRQDEAIRKTFKDDKEKRLKCSMLLNEGMLKSLQFSKRLTILNHMA